MKKLFTLFAMLLMTVCLFAQAPQKMNYQAVVRNANNTLLANQNVNARISILQGDATGAAVYVETHAVTTNANGLMTIEIGGGNATTGNFEQIDWANGPYFIKSEIDPEGGNNYNVTTTQQLLSVPYALYAGSTANGFSGDYNDLTNLPQIPQVPENVSAFNNDAGYITASDIPTQNEGVPFITFNANGGDGYMNAQFCPTGVEQHIALPAYSRSGYVFTGWNTAADGTGTFYANNAPITLTSNITLYAQWSNRLHVELPEPCGGATNSDTRRNTRTN